MFVATQPQRIFLLPGKEVSNVVTFCGQLPKEKKSDNESLKNNFSSSELVLDTSLLGTLPLRVPFSDFASFSLSSVAGTDFSFFVLLSTASSNCAKDLSRRWCARSPCGLINGVLDNQPPPTCSSIHRRVTRVLRQAALIRHAGLLLLRGSHQRHTRRRGLSKAVLLLPAPLEHVEQLKDERVGDMTTFLGRGSEELCCRGGLLRVDNELRHLRAIFRGRVGLVRGHCIFSNVLTIELYRKEH